MPNLGPMEIAIIAVVILVLFGGAKLAGLGKSTGRALREFKEETKSIKSEDEAKKAEKTAEPTGEISGVTTDENNNEFQQYSETVDAEVVESKRSDA